MSSKFGGKPGELSVRCPSCEGRTRAVDSRRMISENTVRRRRECYECKERFTTYERISKVPLEELVAREKIEFIKGIISD